MKKIKKLVALGISAIMATTVLVGCSTNEVTLFKAFMKGQQITSMETQTEINLKVKATGLSSEEEQSMQMLLPQINNSKIQVNSKISQNKEKTVSKVQSDIKMKFGVMPLDMSVWVDMDVSGKEPAIKEIIKMPAILTMQMPEPFTGKEYMVMSSADLSSATAANSFDVKKVAQFSKEFQPKMLDFINKYATQYDPNLDLVTNKGEEDILLPDNTKQHAKIYELRMGDRIFKGLLKYTANNFVNNKDAMIFIKEYMTAVMSISGLPEAQFKETQESMNKAFAEFETQKPQFLEEMNKMFYSLENVNLLGDKGVCIQYAVNKDGYVINERGTIEFVLDLANINKNSNGMNAGSKNSQGPTGIYTVAVDFNTSNYKINENVSIMLPELNINNSINYSDLMKVAAPIPNH